MVNRLGADMEKVAVSVCWFVAVANAGPSRPNILYLIADDMRTQLGCYGHKAMSTPNLDSLAASGLLFEAAYTQFAYCAPSRNSFMSGRRPERTKALNFLTDFRQQHGDSWVALPQHFKNHGYFTTAAGKLYHDGMDDALSWSHPSNQTYWIQCQCDSGDHCDQYKNYCEITNSSKIQFTDEDMILAEGLKRMDLAHQSGQPWFVGIGVHRPHWTSRLPPGWYGSEVYAGQIAPPKYPKAIKDVPWMSGNWQEGDYLDPAHGCPNCSVPDQRSVEYRRWYYAATSYSDHMLGKALHHLDQLGARNSTVVVFHSDHGYQLGELNEWSKKTNNELATRVPMLIRVPWKHKSVGQRTRVRAELVDVYRTLAELAGLDQDLQPDIQGTSLAPLFDNPSPAPSSALATKPAYSQIGSCACGVYTKGNWTGKECDAGRCVRTNVTDFDFMGYTMITAEGWRYTVWVEMNNMTSRVNWTRPVFDELYDLTADLLNDFDFDAYAVNVASAHPELVTTMREQLHAAVDSWY